MFSPLPIWPWPFLPLPLCSKQSPPVPSRPLPFAWGSSLIPMGDHPFFPVIGASQVVSSSSSLPPPRHLSFTIESLFFPWRASDACLLMQGAFRPMYSFSHEVFGLASAPPPLCRLSPHSQAGPLRFPSPITLFGSPPFLGSLFLVLPPTNYKRPTHQSSYYIELRLVIWSVPPSSSPLDNRARTFLPQSTVIVISFLHCLDAFFSPSSPASLAFETPILSSSPWPLCWATFSFKVVRSPIWL